MSTALDLCKKHYVGLDITNSIEFKYHNIIRWKKSGIIKKSAFLYKLFNSSYLKFFSHSEQLPEEEKRQKIHSLVSEIDKLTTLLNSFYGDNWDYNISFEGTYWKFEVDILFEKIEIHNRNEQTHTIRDLLISIKLISPDHRDCLIFHDMRGTRLGLTFAEAISGYHHSHLPSNFISNLEGSEIYSLYGFCLGSGTDMSNFFDSFYADYSFDIDNIEIFFHNLQSFLEYESLEGGPYIKMKNISNRSREDGGATYYGTKGAIEELPQSEINRIIRDLENEIHIEDIKHTFVEGKVLIDLDSPFEDLVKSALFRCNYTQHIIKICPFYSAERNETTHQRWSNNFNTTDYVGNLTHIRGNFLPYYFLGHREIPFRITDFPQEIEGASDISNFYVNPYLFSIIVKHYENELLKKAIRYSHILTKSQSYNAR